MTPVRNWKKLYLSCLIISQKHYPKLSLFPIKKLPNVWWFWGNRNGMKQMYELKIFIIVYVLGILNLFQKCTYLVFHVKNLQKGASERKVEWTTFVTLTTLILKISPWNMWCKWRITSGTMSHIQLWLPNTHCPNYDNSLFCITWTFSEKFLVNIDYFIFVVRDLLILNIIFCYSISLKENCEFLF